MIRIAAIDDEPLNLLTLQHLSTHVKGLQILGLFTKPDELIACVQQQHPDAIILDVEMPEQSGIELAINLKRLDPNIRIVFMTAYEEYAVKAFELGAIDYLVKPLSQERLANTVARIDAVTHNHRDEPVSIQCFGGFEVYLGNQRLDCKLSKAREILALLVHNQGCSMQWDTIAHSVWKETTDERKRQSNFHAATYALRNFLNDSGIGQIFEYRRNSYRIIPNTFYCDAYDFIDLNAHLPSESAKQAMLNLYAKGQYMQNTGYAWAQSRADLFKQIYAEKLQAIQ